MRNRQQLAIGGVAAERAAIEQREIEFAQKGGDGRVGVTIDVHGFHAARSQQALGAALDFRLLIFHVDLEHDRIAFDRQLIESPRENAHSARADLVRARGIDGAERP